MAVAREMVNDNLEEYLDGLEYAVEGTYLEDLDEVTIRSDFRQLATDSVDTMTDMNEGISNISMTVEESAKGVVNVAEEISKLVEAISSITVRAGENKDISDGLSSEVSKFEKM